MQLKQKLAIFIFFGTIVVLTAISTGIHLLTESWWFEAIGYESIFWQRLTWQTTIWGSTFIVFASFLGFNYWLSLKLTGDRSFRFLESSPLELYTAKVANYIAYLFIFLVSLTLASLSS